MGIQRGKAWGDKNRLTHARKGGLCGQDASSSGLLDFLLCRPREEPGLDDDGLLGEDALAENLEEAGAAAVDDGHLLALGLGGRLLVGLRHQGPQLVQVDGGAMADQLVGVNVEVPHTDLAEITRMVFVEVGSVMAETTSVTPTAGVLAVLANTTVSMGHVTTQLPGLLLVGSHLDS